MAYLESDIPLQPTRRRFIGALAGTLLAGCSPQAEKRLVVRTPGGSRDDILRDVLYEPFRKDTGIEIVPVAANTSKMLAMAKVGSSEIDVVDDSTDVLTALAQVNALEPIPYGNFKYANPADFDAPLRAKFYVASALSATVLGYDTTLYSHHNAPKSWTEFWDVNAFPGPRSLGNMAENGGDLELALLADGVPTDKLYPLDLDRAFKSLSRIRPMIVKFWESGAMATQMLVDREVALASIWSTRLAIAAAKGAALAAEWNQCRVEVQAYGMFRNSRNIAAAVRFMDYATSADVQKKTVQRTFDVPANKKAYPAMAKSLIDPATGTPFTASQGFMMDVDYWVRHRKDAENYWSEWIVQ